MTTERVKDDWTIGDLPSGAIKIENPVIIVQKMDGGGTRFMLHLEEYDPLCQQPEIYGIVLSDLMDQIASFYQDINGGRQETYRDKILRTLKEENRL
jgi:hypothetical protein